MVWTPRGCGKLTGYTRVRSSRFGVFSVPDVGGLARSGGYTPLNQSISRVVINLFTLTQESIFRAITEML
jgi:hypothetical protein